MESSITSMPNVEELLQCQSIKEKELDVLKVIDEDKKLRAIQGESLYRKAKEACHTIQQESEKVTITQIDLNKK
jgi:hypothetical protein